MSKAERPGEEEVKGSGQYVHRTLSRAACENGQVCLRESGHVPRNLHMTPPRPTSENGKVCP